MEQRNFVARPRKKDFLKSYKANFDVISKDAIGNNSNSNSSDKGQQGSSIR